MPGLDDALELAREGFRVFPLRGIVNGKCTCGKPECASPGKHPAIAGWQQAATCDEAAVKTMFAPYPSANIGIATGRGLIVVDLDGPEGLAALEQWESKYGPLPPTRRVRTGRGLHLYFQCTEALSNSAGRIAPHVDIRGDGGYVVGPGSIHATGRIYEWEALADDR